MTARMWGSTMRGWQRGCRAGRMRDPRRRTRERLSPVHVPSSAGPGWAAGLGQRTPPRAGAGGCSGEGGKEGRREAAKPRRYTGQGGTAGTGSPRERPGPSSSKRGGGPQPVQPAPAQSRAHPATRPMRGLRWIKKEARSRRGFVPPREAAPGAAGRNAGWSRRQQRGAGPARPSPARPPRPLRAPRRGRRALPGPAPRRRRGGNKAKFFRGAIKPNPRYF